MLSPEPLVSASVASLQHNRRCYSALWHIYEKLLLQLHQDHSFWVKVMLIESRVLTVNCRQVA